jgi:hypothetical protein
MESMFEVVDGHADGVSEAAYVAFAERLNGLCIAKPKAGETRPAQDRSQLRHRWPEAKKPEQFLSGAIKAIQGALDAPPPPKPKTPAKAAPWSRKWMARMVPGTRLARTAVIADMTPAEPAPIRTQGLWGNIGRATKLLDQQLSERERHERAADAIFLEWSTPIYSDVDHPDERRYAGKRRHGDDETAIRLTDLALLLSKVDVALPKKQGLAHLLALYHLLDRDGDGWITKGDFTITILEASTEHPTQGPTLPQPRARGGARSRKGKEAKRNAPAK